MKKQLLLTSLFTFSIILSLSAQNVGVGLNNPQEKLHVDGNLRLNDLAGAVAGVVTVDANGSFQRLAFPGGTGVSLRGDGTFGSLSGLSDADSDTRIQVEANPDEDRIRFTTNGNQRMVMDAMGRIGIGRNNPLHALDIYTNATSVNGLNIVMDSSTNGGAVVAQSRGNSVTGYFQSLSQTFPGPVFYIQQNSAHPGSSGLTVFLPASATGTGAYVTNNGSGPGIYCTTAGSGLPTIYAISNGGAIPGYFELNAPGSVALATDQFGVGGTGLSLGFGGAAGTGVFLDSIADGFGFLGTVNTLTPNVGGNVFGAVVGGIQYGRGAGILINHEGISGRAAEFANLNPINNTEVLFLQTEGQGNVIFAQMLDNTIVGTATVGEFIYGGTDIDDHLGVYSESIPNTGWGIGLEATGGWIGVHGVENDGNNLAGVYSTGDMGASGIKPFIIDHPLDPENLMLRHFALESNEVLNVYRGTVDLDANGMATIEMPDYFESININFSYQLTPVGAAFQPYVAHEMVAGKFTVGGDPNQKISWMVIAERNDPYLVQRPEKREVEMKKDGDRVGKYLMPELYGKSEDMGMFYREEKERVAGEINKDLFPETPEKPAMPK